MAVKAVSSLGCGAFCGAKSRRRRSVSLSKRTWRTTAPPMLSSGALPCTRRTSGNSGRLLAQARISFHRVPTAMTTLGLLNFDVCFYSLKARTFLHAVPMSAKGQTATFETLGFGAVCTHAARRTKIAQSLSLTTVCGRSRPLAVSVCHLPLSSSYSMVSVWPEISCSRAAACAAASASSNNRD